MDERLLCRAFAAVAILLTLAGRVMAFDDAVFDPPASAPSEEYWVDDQVFDGDGPVTDAYASPSWFTLRVGAVAFHRPGNQTHVLLSNQATGQTLLTTSDADPGWAAGPEIDFLLHLSPETDFEFDWFSIGDWSDQRVVNLGGTVVNPIGAPLTNASVGVESRFRNFEFNLRRRVWDSFTLLAGYRYIEFDDTLAVHYESSILGVSEDARVQIGNRLYGFQIGAQTTLWRSDGWSVDGWLKAGVFGNAATHSTNVVFNGIPAPTSAIRAQGTNTAFVGDLGVRGVRRLGRYASIYVGYRLMFVDGVALAVNQYDNIVGFFNGGGQRITTNGSPLFQGLDAGVSFAF